MLALESSRPMERCGRSARQLRQEMGGGQKMGRSKGSCARCLPNIDPKFILNLKMFFNDVSDAVEEIWEGLVRVNPKWEDASPECPKSIATATPNFCPHLEVTSGLRNLHVPQRAITTCLMTRSRRPDIMPNCDSSTACRLC